MKKKEYVSPEMEIVEFTEQGGILQGASDGTADGGFNSGTTPPPPPAQGGSSRRSIFDDED